MSVSKVLLSSSLLLSFFIFFSSASLASDVFPDTLKRDTVLVIPANLSQGFNYDYVLYLPKGFVVSSVNHLLVETNNSGWNDTMSYHLKETINEAKRNSVGSYVSRKMKLPYLMPVFPRSATNMYTHALDRDVMLCREKKLKRLDLQLVAMINDAKKQLAKYNIIIKDKVFMTGFSASGTFANRFTLLHPELIQATSAGGINAIVILPFKELKNSRLNYPLGINDIKKITGKEADLETYRKVPKHYYMGELDDNDAAAYDDAYSTEERQQIYDLMGKKLTPDRWLFMSEAYKSNGITADFITYPNIGHGTDMKIKTDVVEFFLKHSN